MKKNIVKGLYCLAVMMITLGTAFLVPSFVGYTSGLLTSNQTNTKVEGAERSDENGEAVEDTNDGFGLDEDTYKSEYVDGEEYINLKETLADERNKALLEANSVAMSSQVTMPNYNNNAAAFYTIDSKQDLITIAYNILNGDTDWASRNYMLTTDIDLSGALWTPIGTNANRFHGIFFGGNHTISNIVVYSGVSTAANSAVGFFGEISDASIQNLTIKNYRCIGDTTYSGALTGAAYGISTIANCYVLNNEGATDNTPFAIATMGASVGVYRGGSRDGVTAHYTTASEIAATLKVNGTPGVSGYAVSYKVNGGRIMEYYSQTDASNTDYQYSFYGAMMNSSMVAQAGRGFYGAVPTTRAAAMAAQSGTFAIKEGYEFTVGEANASNGYISTLSWSARNDTVTMHYGYNKNDNGSGTNATGERTENITVPYDAAWLSSNALGGQNFTRDGYTLADDKYYFDSAYSSKVGVAGGYFVGDALGQNDNTYTLYLKWSANTGIAYNIDYATPSDDIGFDPVNAFKYFNVYEGSTANEVTKAEGTTYKWDLGGHTASNSVIIKFKLNWGYGFANGQVNEGGMNKVQIGTPNLQNAGICFNGIFDAYRRPNYSSQVDADGEYTVVLDDLVGSGQVYIVVERIKYKVSLNGVDVDWELSELKNAKGETTNTYTSFTSPNEGSALESSVSKQFLNTRVGESFTIKASSKETGEFIANYNAFNFATGVIAETTGTQPEGIKHYIDYSWKIQNYIAQVANDLETAGEILAVSKALVVKLTVEVVYEDDEKTWMAAHPEINKVVAGAYVNTDSGFSAGTTDTNTFTVKLFNNKIGDEDINSTTGMVRTYLHENAYFNLKSYNIEVPKNSTHVPNSSTENIKAENGYNRNCVNFDVDYKDNTDTEENIYKITLTPQRQEYKAEYVIYIDEELADSKYYTAGVSQLISAPDQSVITAKRNPFDTIADVEFALTSLGLDVLVFDKIEISKDPKDYRAAVTSPMTQPGSLQDGTYTVATSDTIISVYYIRKSITFTLEMKAYVDNVNGKTGINTILDSAEKTLGLAYDKTGEDSKKNVTAKIKFDGTAFEFLEGNISNIDLMYGYYLLGWYLQNGSIISLNNTSLSSSPAAIPTTGDHLDWVKAAREPQTLANAFVMVQQKVVKLSFNKGGDALVSINTPKYEDGKAHVETYYHDQEEFADLFIDFKPTAFAFSKVQDFVRKIAMGPVSKWSGDWEGASHEFMSEGNFSTTVVKDVPYGEANEVILEFYPIFEDYLVYNTDIYYQNPSVKTGTMQIKLKDKVIMTVAENGAATYSINGVTFTTPQVPGHTAVGFKFKGNASATDVLTEFILSEEVITTYLASAYYYETIADAIFQIETIYKANTYKVFIDLVPNIELYVEGAEIDTDGRYFVWATYGQEVTQLQNVVVTRAGYTLGGFASAVNMEVEYAKLEQGAWTFPTLFLSTSDIHVKPNWLRYIPGPDEDGYIKILNIDNIEITFNGTYQTVATASFRIDGNESPNLDILENGDKVVSQYWAKANDTNTSVGNSLSLTLRNVSDSGDYVYVVNVQSQNGIYAQPYTIVSNTFKVTINPSKVNVYDYALKGFYTGTGDYIAASDSQVGVLRFNDETLITDGIVSASAYSFTGNDGSGNNIGFNVGGNREVKIKLVFGENELENFTDVRGNQTDGYYIVAAVGEIVKANLTFALSGKGFEVEGMLHEIPFMVSSDNYNLASYQFNIAATIKTNNWSVGLYSDGNITSEIKVTKGESAADLKDNFDIVFVDSYEIVAASIIYNYDIRYLTADNGSLKTAEGQYRLSGTMTDVTNSVRITGVTINGVAVNVDFNDENIYYLDSVTKTPIFTIFGNGTANLKIAIDNNYLTTLKFTVEVTSSDALAFLGYFESNAVTNYEAILDAYTTQVRTSSPELRETKITYYAVYTDAKAVTISSTDNDATIYVSASIGYTFATPSRIGFTFNEWEAGNGVTAEINAGNTQVSVVGSVPSTLSATWTLDAPTAENAKSSITKAASADEQNITLSELIGRIANLNNSHINYTYEWKKGLQSLSTKDFLAFNKLTTLDAGDYSLTVTATTKDGTQTKASTFDFSLVVERLQITSFVLSSQTEVYANTDFASTISATLNIAGSDSILTVGANLNNTKNIFFTITKSETGVSMLKTIGIYSITLNVDESIYEVSSTIQESLTFEITKATLTITDETLRKAFGQQDPALVITKTANGELVKVTFTRTAGESVGSYAMTYSSCDNENYNVSATGNTFVIEKLASNLRVTLASNFSMTYNGKVVSRFEPRYMGEDDAKAWYLLALDSEGNVLAQVALSLTYQDPTSNRYKPVTTNIENAFDGFSISAEGIVKNAGTYPLGCSGSSETYQAMEFTSDYDFAITKASISVESISKVFDENADFSWTSNVSGGTTMVVSGLAEGDAITISGSLSGVTVGTHNITAIAVSGNDNYNSTLASTPENASITISNLEVKLSASNMVFDYAQINKATAHNASELEKLLGLVFTADDKLSNALSAGHITLSSVAIGTDADYSTGLFLKVGSYDVVFTLTSTNYANANGEFTIKGLTINQIALDLSENVVTKEYDGTMNLPDMTWVIKTIATGDVVNISGKYTNSAISTGIALELDLTGADAANYTIDTSSQPTGSITSRVINLSANLNTTTFVDGFTFEPAAQTIKITYTGSDEAFIAELKSKFASKTGYTQKAWTFGENLTLNKANFALFLSNAISAEDSYEINAVWEINQLTINLSAANATIKNGENIVTSEIKINYHDSLNLVIAGNTGYRYNSYSYTGETKGVTPPTGVTNNETLILENIVSGGTLTINMAEIQVNVIIDMSQAPVECEAQAEWTTKQLGLASYKDSLAVNVLAGITTKAGTYEFHHYTVGGVEVTSSTTFISTIADQTKDSSVTFVAVFEPATLNLTISNEHANVIVKIGDETITGTDGVYEVYYNANVNITITGKEGWKFEGISHEEDGANAYNTTGTGNLNASITIDAVKKAQTLTINMAEIVVTIKAEANSENLINTGITSTWTSKSYNYSVLNSIVNNLLDKMTVTAGTYTQTGWTYEENEVTNANILNLIKTANGQDLTSDYTLPLAFKPIWKGVDYKLTFHKNNPPDGVNPSFENEDADGTVTIAAVYGSRITMPTFNLGTTAYNYTWNTLEDGTGTNYNPAGDTLRNIGTANDEDAYTLALYAKYTEGNFELTVNFDSNVTKLVDGADTEITNGSIYNVLGATDVTLIATLQKGYEIDLDSTSIGQTGVTISLDANGYLVISGITQDTTLNIATKARTYKFYIDSTSYENVTGAMHENDKYYVNVDFKQKLEETALNDVRITRLGYTLSALTNAEGESIATFASDAWTFNVASHEVAGDVILTPVWTAIDNYYSITFDNKNVSVSYTSEVQKLATATLKVDGTDIAWTDALTNGDEIIDYYFARVGEADTLTKVSAGNELSLRNVADSGEYVLVFTIRDARTGTSRTLQSAANVNVTINKVDLGMKDTNLESYYTGTNKYSATSAANNGSFVIGGIATTDASLSRFEFTAAHGVSENLDIRVYISMSEANRANYSNIQGNDTDGYYITLTGVARVVASPIVITAKGSGYYTGSIHNVSYQVSTNVAGLNLDNFDFAITLQTKEADFGVGVKNDFTLALFKAMLGGNDASAYFTNTITGEYEILSTENAYTYVISPEFLGEESTANFTISNLSVDSAIVTLNGAFVNYTDAAGNIIFSLTGNGTNKVVLVANKDNAVKFDVTVEGIVSPYDFVGFTSDISEENMKAMLAALTSKVTRTYTESLSQNSTIYAVVSNWKAVNVDFGDKASETQTVFAVLGGEVELETPVWTGFKFNGFTCPSGISYLDGKLTCVKSQNILPATITANWILDNPTTSENNNALTRKANENNETISIDEVIGTITNRPTEENLISYTYAWFNAKNEQIGSGDSLAIAANTESDGTYYVVITANKNGYASAVSEHIDFTLSFNTISLSVSTTQAAKVNYANKDFADEIMFTITIDGTAKPAQSLKSLLADGNIKMVVTGGDNDGVIKNVGSYTIILVASNKLYNVTPFSFTIEVEKYAYELQETDVNLSKNFGAADPELKVTLNILGEEVEVAFTRASGETVGNYKLSIVDSYNPNYMLTIDENNEYFKIESGDGKLQIEVDDISALTKVYNNKNTTFDVKFVNGKWTLYAYNEGESNAIASTTLTLNTLASGVPTELTGDALKIALDGASFAIEGDNNKAGEYPIIVTTGANYKTTEFAESIKFKVATKELIVSLITKGFDRTANFTTENVTFTGIVSDDEVTITGAFANATAGTQTVESIVLGGIDSDNYSLNYAGAVCSITKSAEEITIEVDNLSFEYGVISNETDLKAILNAIIKVGGKEVTSEDEIDYTVNLSLAAYSTSNNLNANDYTLTFTITTPNYANAGAVTKTLTITKKSLDLTGSVVTKAYDGTDSLPQGQTWVLGGLVDGDKVEITGHYENKDKGTNKTLILEVANSNDGVNYTIGTTVTGTISDAVVKLVVDYQTRANFVDTQSVASSEFFNIEYPANNPAAEILSGLTYPTRIGYYVTGWSYFDESTKQYVDITENNIDDVLKLAFENNKQLTIFASWEIDQIEITINVNNASLAHANLVANKLTINYYDDVTISVTGDEGWKFMDAKLTAGTITGDISKTDVGKKNAAFSLSHVKSNATIDVIMEEIVITVKVDENIPQYTTMISEAIANREYLYSQVDTAAIGLIEKPKVTDGTYVLAGFTSGATTITLDSTVTLKSILGEVTEDTTISFTANWVGEKYTIYFDANGGQLTNDVSSITAIYGNSMDETFAEVNQVGMNYSWNTLASGEGDSYAQGDILTTIGTAGADGYQLTLYAIWTSKEAVLTVVFTDPEITSVRVSDDIITSGKTYNLVYGQDEVFFTVSTAQGYSFTYSLSSEADGVIEKINSTIKVSMLNSDSTLTISKKALANNLTIANSLSTIESVTIDGVEAQINDSILVADTGSTVVLKLNANVGYIFDEKSKINIEGSGSITTDINNGSITITWTGFNSDSKLNVTASAKVNTITIKDSSNYVSNLTINGSVVNVKGDTFEVTTGSELTINVILRYGYVASALKFVGADLTPVSLSENFDETLRVYSRSFTLAGFTSDFEMSVIADARNYEFNVDTANFVQGSVSVAGLTDKAAAFGSTINLTAMPKEDYVFEGWYVGEQFISSSKDFAFTLNTDNRDILESGYPVTITAHFASATRDITITSGMNGRLVYSVDGGEEVTIYENSSSVRTFSFGNTLIIMPNPNAGYEVETVKLYNSSNTEISGDWYNKETNTITIVIGQASAVTRIEVTYKASVAVVNIVAAAEINYQISYGVDFGGKVYLATEAGVKIEKPDVDKYGYNYTHNTITGTTFYLLVEPNGESAYSYDLTSNDEGVIINRSRINPNLYEIVGDGVRDGITIAAIFTAQNLSVNVKYVNGDTPAAAGSISVQTGGFVVAAGNNSSDVVVSALPGQDFIVDLYTNLSYSFLDENGKPDIGIDGLNEGVIIEAIENYTDEQRIRTGFSQHAVLRVNNLSNNGTITIKVTPKRYKIILLSDGNQIGGALSGITYGQQLSIVDSQSIIPENRDGYQFKGYYTMELGQGRMYINELGQAVQTWEENGYKWNGAQYERSSYFKGDDTFELYAGWYYTKEKISLNFIPDELKDKVDAVNILNFVTATDSNVSIWMSGDNKFYAEAQEGKRIALRAYNFEGYTFKYWSIDRGDGNIENVAGNVYEYITQNGDVSITAVYEANYTLEVYNEGLEMIDPICGTTELRQNNIALNQGSFDTTKPVTIVVNANPGFKFKGWFDLKANDWLKTSSGDIVTDTIYTFENLLTDQLKLRAVFEGSEIGVKFDLSGLYYNGQTAGTRGKVILNGKEIATPDVEFEARVGDTIKVEINTNYNFGVSWKGAIFTMTEDGYFTYRISALDLEHVSGGAHDSVLIISPVADPNPISYEFELMVENDATSGEIQLVGSLRYQSRELSTGSKLDALFGHAEMRIDVVLSSYYKIGGVYIEVSDIRYDITRLYVESQRQIRLTSDILETYDAGVDAHIIVNYARVLWTDYRSDALSGAGTSANPYKITCAEDLALLAYAVNHGLSNNNLAYKDAYYEVTRDIDLGGRYWVPIGTSDHLFNGIIYLGEHQIKNISHYMTYLPNTYYEGLIWYLTDKAQVITSNNDLVLALSIAGGVLVLLLVIVIIIIIARKKKKKKLDELANS